MYPRGLGSNGGRYTGKLKTTLTTQHTLSGICSNEGHQKSDGGGISQAPSSEEKMFQGVVGTKSKGE